MPARTRRDRIERMESRRRSAEIARNWTLATELTLALIRERGPMALSRDRRWTKATEARRSPM